jgi:hypothetical protein
MTMIENCLVYFLFFLIAQQQIFLLSFVYVRIMHFLFVASHRKTSSSGILASRKEKKNDNEKKKAVN